jgi:hypothetical protein
VKLIYLAAALVVVGLIAVAIWVPAGRVIAITALVMLGVGSTAALIWWSLADAMFPGASRRTGQHIRIGRGAGGAAKGGEGARVIRGFEGSAPGEGERRG